MVALRRGPSYLEQVLQRELDQARVGAGGGDLSKGAWRVSSHRRVTELRMVQEIEKFGAELDGLPFRDLRALEDGPVEIELARSEQNA